MGWIPPFLPFSSFAFRPKGKRGGIGSTKKGENGEKEQTSSHFKDRPQNFWRGWVRKAQFFLCGGELEWVICNTIRIVISNSLKLRFWVPGKFSINPYFYFLSFMNFLIDSLIWKTWNSALVFPRNRNNLFYIWQLRLRLPCLSFFPFQLMSPAILAHVVTVSLWFVKLCLESLWSWNTILLCVFHLSSRYALCTIVSRSWI
jgi:hypothetical protein